MHKYPRLLTVVSLALTLAALHPETALSQLTNRSKLSINSLGTVKVGMTVTEAAKALGTKLIGDPPNKFCYYLKPQKGPGNIGFMVAEGRIARIDIWKNSGITTMRGAKIGDSEARIKSLYPGQIKVTPHQYVPGGHYLTLVPKDAADRNYRVVFETDGKRVTQFRSGKLPEVEFVEGCS